MRRISKNVLCLAAIFALAGCSSWFKKDKAADDPVPLVEFNQTAPVQKLWSFDIGKAGAYTFIPVVSGDSVYASAANGTLARINVRSGVVFWKIDTGTKLTAGVGTDGETVVVAGVKGLLMAYDNTGKQLWKVQASSEILSAPAVGQGSVLVRSVDNLVAAYDVKTGERRWTLQRTLPSLTLLTAPGITIVPRAAFVALPGGRLSALNLVTGGPWWEMAIGQPHGITELERVSDASGQPLIAGRDVCAVAYQGNIGCFDAGSGRAIWSRKFSSAVGLGGDNDSIYAADAAGVVQAFKESDGTPRWSNTQLGYRMLSAPAVLSSTVAVGDYEGYVHFLAKDSGQLVARIATDKTPVLAAPAVSGDEVIIQTQGGQLVALTTTKS